MRVLEWLCDVDDFMRSFAPQWRASQLAAGKQRERAGQLWPREVMTILIHVHQSHARTFQAYDTEHVQVYVHTAFPHLVSSARVVALIPGLLASLQSRFGPGTGIRCIDSTSLDVCDPKRIRQHRVFATDATRGKTSMGWFCGFTLHLAVTDRGDLLACCVTPGTVDDRQPVPQMVTRLRGTLRGDRGSLSAPLATLLFEQGLQLITRLRTHRTNRLLHLSDTLVLRTRAISASLIDPLKNISQIEHARHRSPPNVVVHVMAGLSASSHQDTKPSLHVDERPLLAA